MYTILALKIFKRLCVLFYRNSLLLGPERVIYDHTVGAYLYGIRFGGKPE